MAALMAEPLVGDGDGLARDLLLDGLARGASVDEIAEAILDLHMEHEGVFLDHVAHIAAEATSQEDGSWALGAWVSALGPHVPRARSTAENTVVELEAWRRSETVSTPPLTFA